MNSLKQSLAACLEQESVSLEDIERLASVISVESAVSIGSKLDIGREKIAPLMVRVATYFKHNFIQRFNFGELSPNELVKNYTKLGFSRMSNVQVPVPGGFKGKWLDYSEELKGTREFSVRLFSMLDNYNRTLGLLINDPTYLHGASGAPYQGEHTLGIDDYVKRLVNNNFDPVPEAATRPLSTVLDRIGDLPQVYRNMNDVISLEKTYKVEEVNRTIERIMSKAPALVRKLEGDPKIDKTAFAEFVKLTVQLAREIESYGTLIYMFRQFVTAMKEVQQVSKSMS